MSTTTHIEGRVRRALGVAVLSIFSGCAGFNPSPTLETSPPDSPEAVQAHPSSSPAPPSAPDEGATLPDTQDAPSEIALLFDAEMPGHADVAAAIAASLGTDRYRVELIDVRAAAQDIAAIGARQEPLVVAVGLEATELARRELTGAPLVFCQVFNYESLLDGRDSIWGVHTLPPLALQLRAWKAVDPALARVGLIVSDAHQDVVEGARSAAERLGVALHDEVSASDRETLYLFKRLAPEIDGLLLFPDNRILSSDVLRELLSYALAHDVGVLVFNDALLAWGALLSVTTPASEVARAVADVIEQVVDGRTQGLPAMTELTSVELRVNPLAATRLGATTASAAPWVLREPD